MGRRSHLLFIGGGGGVLRYGGVTKQKSPDFRSPEVGISALLNYFLLIAKLHLWDCRRSQIRPTIAGFKTKRTLKFEFK